MVEEYVPEKKQDKSPEEQLSGDRQSIWKRIQSNDSKDDPGSQKKKKMEAQTKKIQEMFNKELKDIEQSWTIIEMKNTLEGINSRINKAEERKALLWNKIKKKKWKEMMTV